MFREVEGQVYYSAIRLASAENMLGIIYMYIYIYCAVAPLDIYIQLPLVGGGAALITCMCLPWAVAPLLSHVFAMGGGAAFITCVCDGRWRRFYHMCLPWAVVPLWSHVFAMGGGAALITCVCHGRWCRFWIKRPLVPIRFRLQLFTPTSSASRCCDGGFAVAHVGAFLGPAYTSSMCYSWGAAAAEHTVGRVSAAGVFHAPCRWGCATLEA